MDLGRRQSKREQAGSVYIGLALSRSFSWQKLQLAVGWGRASQTANERLLLAERACGDGEAGGPRLTSPRSCRLLRGTMPPHVLCRPGFSSSCEQPFVTWTESWPSSPSSPFVFSQNFRSAFTLA